MSQSPVPPQQPTMVMGPDLPGATAALVLGILSIVLSWPIVGLVLGFIGLQKARQARRITEMNPGVTYPNAGVVQAGFVCSIIGLVLSSLSTLGCCAYGGVMAIFVAANAAAAAGQGG